MNEGSSLFYRGTYINYFHWNTTHGSYTFEEHASQERIELVCY